jgi:hypothetical protein
MDVLVGVGAGLLIGIPWAFDQLSQRHATPGGFRHVSAPACEPLTGSAREVGTPDSPHGVPTSTTYGEER